ncbi:MAG: hypothetical protein ACM3NW_13280 [Syntrophomonadaceae bacterium]
MTNQEYPADRKAAPREKGARRSVLLLLTISALLFVGMQSRIAQSLPTRSPEQLLTSLADPVKFPPPEERAMDGGWVLTVPAGDAVSEPPARRVGEAPLSIPFVGERHADIHLLRAPPVSL